MKTLKIKKSSLATIYSAIKNLPPKEFETVDKMNKVCDGLLPAMEDKFEEYDKLRKEAEEIKRAFGLEKIKEEEANEKLTKINKKITKLDLRDQGKEIEMEFEDDHFNLLFDLFSKYGKNLFNKMETYRETTKAFDETNRQPKSKKKSKKN